MQIWHYYVLSKYDAKANIIELLDSFGNDEINPIILAGFVKEKDAANKELFDYIKRLILQLYIKKERILIGCEALCFQNGGYHCLLYI